MKKNIQIMVLAMIALIFFSCNDKNSSIEKLESFTTELKENSEKYDAGDWKAAEKKYNGILENLNKYQDEMTQEEKDKVAKLNEECAGYFAKGMEKLLKDGIDMVGNLVEGVDGMLESTDNMMENLDNMFE